MVYFFVIYIINSRRGLRLMQSSLSTWLCCSNALPFNSVRFPKGNYPGKLTQRQIMSEQELSEQLDCLSQ